MNDAIFKFKRYEDASLTYTGIDKHSNDEVGGWDTTIRKAQYEKLFYNQQSSMIEAISSGFVQNSIKIEKEQSQPKEKLTPQSPIIAPVEVSTQEVQTAQEIETQLESIGTDSIVYHKNFGEGTIIRINKNEKYIHVKFTLGEKKFIFPDAFLMGFLEIE